jgi:hypothetical protein
LLAKIYFTTKRCALLSAANHYNLSSFVNDLLMAHKSIAQSFAVSYLCINKNKKNIASYETRSEIKSQAG